MHHGAGYEQRGANEVSEDEEQQRIISVEEEEKNLKLIQTRFSH